MNCRFLSDYRSPICSIYEEKEFDATDNGTRPGMRRPVLKGEGRQSAEGAAKNILKYESTAFFE